MPDIEILNLKDFSTLDVLSKLEGLWLNKDLELIYAVACRITWICPMTFDSFPLDVQVKFLFPTSTFYRVSQYKVMRLPCPKLHPVLCGSLMGELW